MIDYRYHALSLAAVLFALALGVLIGVAIGDSNVVSSAKNGIVHSLKSEVAQSQREAAHLQEQVYEEEALASGLYPLAVHEQLTGRSIGLVFFGASSDRLNSLVRSAVTQAGASLAVVAAVREPLQLEAIAREASGTHYAGLTGSVELVSAFGRLAGRELVSGGPLVGRDLLSRVRASLLSAFDGQLGRLEGLVVVHADPAGMTPAQALASSAFETGLLAGVSGAGATAVGVELRGAQPSQVPWYKTHGIASVDDLDTLAGQAALPFALAGDHGAFGLDPSAESLLPGVPASGAGS